MPKTRSASLRVAHSRSCPRYGITALDPKPKEDGTSIPRCACKPSYYTSHRRSDGTVEKGQRVRDRQVAERALRKLQVEIDEDRLGLRRPMRDKTFRQWTDEYLEILERDKGNKASTVRAYRATLGYALHVLGPLELHLIDQAALRRVVRVIRDTKASDATLHKHLRHLGAIFRAAEDEGHIDASPLTRKFVRDLRLRVPKGDEPYTDIELATLWAKMETLGYDAVYVTVCKAAVVTGARRGELSLPAGTN